MARKLKEERKTGQEMIKGGSATGLHMKDRPSGKDA